MLQTLQRIMKLIRKFTPDKSLTPPEHIVHFIRSDNKYQSVWQYLKRYENPSYVKRRLSSKYSGLSTVKLNKKSRHIASCIKQAESYFNSASNSSLSIKPLIIYYGMLNLSKALIMFGNNEYKLESKDFSKHGLIIRPKKNNISDRKIRSDQENLTDEFAYVSSGRSIYKLLHACWSEKELNGDIRFSLGDLASAHPDSWKAITLHLGIVPKIFIADGSFRTTKQLEHCFGFSSVTQFNLYKKPQSEDAWDFFERIMPRLTKYYTRDANNTFYFISKKVPTTIDEMFPVWKSITGESYVMSDITTGKDSIVLHPIEIEFISMFILGSLTRYIPQKWLGNIEYEKSEEMFLLEGLINTTLISFPKLILEELEEKEYTFTGNTSTWSF